MSGGRDSAKRWVVLGAFFGSLLFAALAPSLADASKPSHHHHKPSGKHKHHHHKKHRRTVKSRGGPLSLKLGTLAISAPKGAIRKGQTLTIEKGASKKFPALGAGSIAGGPFTISTSQGEPAKPVKVIFHYNPAGLAQGGSPVVLHGWSAFGNWVPEESVVSSSTKTVSAKLDSFSPLDVVEDITWAAGLITGNRTDLPSGCGAAPSWVDGLSFPDAPNDSLPSCIGSGSNASTLYIHIVNNRGYAQFVTASGASIDVSHSSWGDSLESTIANGLAGLSTGNTPSSFLLAPGSQVTIAIDRPQTSFGETTVTLHSAPQGATAAAAMGWALLNKLKAELGSGVDATNCVIGYLHNTLSANPSVSSVVGQLHSCASAAAAGLKGSAKTAAEKIASAVLVTDFFYKVIDLAADDLYPPQISFSIPGKNPTNPDIHLGNLDFGTIPAGQQTVEHLTASGGAAPYSFAVWNEPANEANVPSWVSVASDGTMTINPPSGTDQSVAFYVYVTDANLEHSPFAREQVTFSVGGGVSAIPLTGVTAISASGGHTCALILSGTPMCWGWGFWGQLGDGTDTGPETSCGGSLACSKIPVEVSGITNASAISAGEEGHTCAVLTTGEVECWGLNQTGQLGDGTDTGPELCSGSIACSKIPVEVSGITNAISVSAGYDYTCAVLTTEEVECWGLNDWGQLGNGTQSGPESCGVDACSTTPVAVSGITNATAISAGMNHACALLSTGQVNCWGDHSTGQLGLGTQSGPETCTGGFPCSTTPVAVSGITNATAISAGSYHTCASLPASGVECWGDNTEGELGDEDGDGPEICMGGNPCSATPVAVSGITNATAISAGSYHTCAVLVAGQVDCWGENSSGQLGIGSDTGPETCDGGICSTAPVAVRELTNAVAVSAGGGHTCAVLSTSEAECWGSGPLGDGTVGESTIPVVVISPG